MDENELRTMLDSALDHLEREGAHGVPGHLLKYWKDRKEALICTRFTEAMNALDDAQRYAVNAYLDLHRRQCVKEYVDKMQRFDKEPKTVML